MGNRSFEQAPKERHRKTVNVPAKAGDYASEVLTFGAVSSGTAAQSFVEIMALAETLVTGAQVELWLPRNVAGDEAASDRTDADYFNSGTTPLTTQGAVRWPITAWSGARVRVRSGGVSGQMAVSASGY